MSGPCAEALDRAIDASIGFLLQQQGADGRYTDWDLAPGPSSGWITGYVGCRLASLHGRFRQRTAAATLSAARWLIDNEADGGGWAYNDSVDCDADSTANAMLFLSLAGGPVAHRSDACLMSFQRPDGGFSTYRADEGLGSWGLSHVDVSAVCGCALLTRHDRRDAALERTIAYVAGQRNRDGLWDSFWWRSRLYATRNSLAFLRAADAPIDLASTRRGLHSVDAGNAFERALLLDSLLLAGVEVGDGRIAELFEFLVRRQLGDGSWISEPILRVTRRDCTEPWNCANPGPLHADTRRLFTSATVLAALCSARGCLPAAEMPVECNPRRTGVSARLRLRCGSG
jgi:hypothetical protein